MISVKWDVRSFLSQHLNEVGLLVVIAILYLVFSQTANGFLSIYNQQNILRDAAAIGIAACAATLIIVSGDIDVSVGPMVAFLSVVLAFLLHWSFPLILAVPISIICGIALGACAGVLRAYFDVPSFVATLGLWSILRGLALFFTNALPVSFPRSPVLDALDGDFLGLPVAAWIMLVTVLIFAFIANKTSFGRSVYAVGGNAGAAHLAGIPVKRVRVILFAIAGLLAGVSAILLTARLGSGNAGAATGLEFDVIAAVVIGGTALSGGKGTLLGTLLGVMVITLIGNGLVLLGINPFFQDVIRGVIIVVAVLLNIAVARRNARVAAGKG
ncbi:putative sugar transporter subunit: membrane component of ABC superfamily [Vibrio nigripulchritudo SOn1]|uniref:Sugar transporter subunit: membrane component of ABC superfamily n=1 Tax=Vibrio nigripulchritudo SOn1 TaxID=1238450 RepID=A0AAV2W1X3_9VIBR|nr:ABC transporter permease [Vibrio nigripulchritudo]CCO50346.1 putative sugar transporter subunit: membrane component of ABC superfamily [Vibrio nigripulchritudo SOn1]